MIDPAQKEEFNEKDIIPGSQPLEKLSEEITEADKERQTLNMENVLQNDDNSQNKSHCKETVRYLP